MSSMDSGNTKPDMVSIMETSKQDNSLLESDMSIKKHNKDLENQLLKDRNKEYGMNPSQGPRHSVHTAHTHRQTYSLLIDDQNYGLTYS